MNLEHIEAVKNRIEDIRRRFVDPSENSRINDSRQQDGAGFEGILKRAAAGKPAQCPAYLEPIIADAAQKYGISASVIKAVINAESGFRAGAVSSVGAQGLMQLMPGTARALGVDPDDPVQNVDGGTRYLKQQLDRFGSLDLALAAYNAGPGAVVKYGGAPPYAETQRYIQKVLGSIEAYSQED